MNDTRIYQKMKNKSLLSTEKHIVKWEKTILRSNDLESSFEKVILNLKIYFKKLILTKKNKKTNRKNSKVTSNYKLKKKYQETSKPFIKINKKNYKCWWYWNWKIQFSPT